MSPPAFSTLYARCSTGPNPIGCTGRGLYGAPVPCRAMAQTATIFRFEIELSDVERNIYGPLRFRCAQHPSESAERMILRVLALALLGNPEDPDPLEFGRGLSDPDDAALWQRDPTGDVTLWVDMGVPSAQRLHKASKHARRVVVVTDKDDVTLKKNWSAQKIHKAEGIDVIRFDPRAITALSADMPRLVKWTLTHHDGYVHIDNDGENTSLEVTHTTVANLTTE